MLADIPPAPMLRPFTSARSICVEITNECLLRASRSPLPLSTHAPHNRSFSRQNSPSRAQPQISRRYDVRSYSSQKPERPEKQRHAIPQILRMARINIYVRIDGRMRFILRRKAKEERYLDLRTSEFSVYTESWGNYLLRMGWIPVTLSERSWFVELQMALSHFPMVCVQTISPLRWLMWIPRRDRNAGDSSRTQVDLRKLRC